MRVGWMVFLVLMVWGSADAEIYMYRDTSGQIHFTDSPNARHIDIMGARPLEKPKVAPSERVWSSTAYDAFIVQAAERYNVPFALVKAVIHAESGFNPRALSAKGAKGLMQLMPVNISFYKIKDPYDPLENIMGGSAYLKRLLTDFQGNTKMALAAYNAGPTKVKHHNGIPPIAETRAYVAKVERFNKYYSVN
ncbi:lytic transglycosylase [Desulfoluna limicola]|uniref:Lytic transglycosylase n=2 Tax=Desulfoluna limicola TaxID=2810562 RepID=A0ABM7PM39_9BACT|nr:lytic transglycosylase [Desulfoluna limicola]